MPNRRPAGHSLEATSAPSGDSDSRIAGARARRRAAELLHLGLDERIVFQHRRLVMSASPEESWDGWLPGGRPRRLLAPDRGLVNGRPHALRAHRRRARNGAPAPPARPRTGPSSDQRSQYVSLAFGQTARAAGIAQSMGSRGDCFDAIAESFFATLKEGGADPRPLLAVEGRTQNGGLRVHRRHSTLGSLSPAQFETITHEEIDKITTTATAVA